VTFLPYKQVAVVYKKGVRIWKNYDIHQTLDWNKGKDLIYHSDYNEDHISGNIELDENEFMYIMDKKVLVRYKVEDLKKDEKFKLD
jgi:hypothetical protein